ncbi:50S ribosomal protein L24 [Candidatus Sneabacter namystus]|uniref:Large ribosomal subunit protein uL24 n=1 Tax=Candidatus Sneabacter namystus TaxID=2601646 RepID=A0A5C0UJ10_9RICK|nr:50S ribosomal protein L24 [Candidatus Sneabacter namystus]QEK39777.1 50S ribosomal protein L24 [Candidatus Sneabacter namystus]
MSKKIKKDLEVVILTGNDKGKIGKVIKVNRQLRKVLVSGIALKKKHKKPNKEDVGGIIIQESFIDLSNVALKKDK